MTRLMLLAVPLLLAGSAAPAKTHHHAASLKWMDGPPSLPSGAQMAVVSGNPGQKGRFTIQLKLPADYAVPPHSHPTTEVVKVVSGTLHYGMGDKLDTAQAKTLTAGHSATMKAKMNHWVHAPGPATLQVSAMGPFQITYVDPKDDPRK
jgi:quercetin dioxygenase-like cupin family protein